MLKRVGTAMVAFVLTSSVASGAAANIQSNRWFHEVRQEGRDLHITLQLIEEDPPNFDTTFMLAGGDTNEAIFREKKFQKEHADEVIEFGCISLFPHDTADDCDGDGVHECGGICGTAYRYHFVDECVASDHVMYRLWDESTFDEYELDENGIPTGENHFHIFDLEPVNDPCLDSSSCSISSVGGASEIGLAAFMALVGIGFLFEIRRRRS